MGRDERMRPPKDYWRLVFGFAISLGLHGLLWFWIREAPAMAPRPPRILEMEIVRPPPPAPTPPPRREEPKPPKPVRKPVARKPKVVKRVVRKAKEVPRVEKAPPKELPLPEHPSQKEAEKPTTSEKIVGLSSDSFAPDGTQGRFAMSAGNSLLGTPPPKPVAPEAVRPRVQPVSLAEVTTEPVLIDRPSVREVLGEDYPKAAKEAGISGEVRVKLLVDGEGMVREVKAVKGPKLLRPAAIALASRFRYKPARKGKEAVAIWWYEEIAFRITD